jgi:hypothetical protein
MVWLTWLRILILWIHLKNLNVRHIETVEAMGLKIRRRSHLQWHDFSAEFHENIPIGLKVISQEHADGQTVRDRQHGDLISLALFFKENSVNKIKEEKLVVEWLKILLRIREVPSSNLVPKNGYTDPGLSWFYSVPPEECRDSALKLGHDRFLPNSFQFIIHLSPIRCCCLNY